MRKALAVIACSSILFAVACSGDDSDGSDTSAPADSTVTSEPAQIANPASEHCVASGGTVEIVDEADGQVGYCNLPDGTRIEEWEYYRSLNPDAMSPTP